MLLSDNSFGAQVHISHTLMHINKLKSSKCVSFWLQCLLISLESSSCGQSYELLCLSLTLPPSLTFSSHTHTLVYTQKPSHIWCQLLPLNGVSTCLPIINQLLQCAGQALTHLLPHDLPVLRTYEHAHNHTHTRCTTRPQNMEWTTFICKETEKPAGQVRLNVGIFILYQFTVCVKLCFWTGTQRRTKRGWVYLLAKWKCMSWFIPEVTRCALFFEYQMSDWYSSLIKMNIDIKQQLMSSALMWQIRINARSYIALFTCASE